MTKITRKKYWEQIHLNVDPIIAEESDTIRQWIEQNFSPVKKSENKTCIEIGCYPGRYLQVFGELGYKLNGIDYCEKVDLMANGCEKAGYSVGQFWKEDFLKFNPKQKFDIVASFGFIEHFTNFNEMIEKQISLLAEQGYLVIEVPNFIGGFQHWFHLYFDKVNYDRHYIPAMDIESWLDILKQHDLSVVHKGYLGEFNFWTGGGGQKSVFKRRFLRFLDKLRPYLADYLPRGKRMYSPFMGVIARKN